MAKIQVQINLTYFQIGLNYSEILTTWNAQNNIFNFMFIKLERKKCITIVCVDFGI
jgi:hypothetical protein